jgi:hypothetical protein
MQEPITIKALYAQQLPEEGVTGSVGGSPEVTARDTVGTEKLEEPQRSEPPPNAEAEIAPEAKQRHFGPRLFL